MTTPASEGVMDILRALQADMLDIKDCLRDLTDALERRDLTEDMTGDTEEEESEEEDV